MAAQHEIKKLEVQISGNVTTEIQHALQEVVPRIIEKYFDQYVSSEKIIIIDKIDFDLGTINSDNFEEEVAVRLSYLLNSELQKFFSQQDIDEKLEEKVVISQTDALITYLKEGHSGNEDMDLSSLFEHLLQTNIQLLREVIEEAKLSDTARKRIYYQVRFELIEKYWSLVHQQAFRSITSINKDIIGDSRATSATGSDEKSIQSIVKRLTFEFMMGVSPESGGAIAYLEMLKENIEEFRHLESQFKKSAYQFIDEISLKYGDQSSDYKSERTAQVEFIPELYEYINLGKYAERISKTDEVNLLKKLHLEELAKLILTSSNLTKSNIDRLQTVLTAAQFETILKTLEGSSSSKLGQKITELNYLKNIVDELFSEKISDSLIASYLGGSATSGDQVDQNLLLIIDAIAVKKDLTKDIIAEQLIDKFNRSFHKDAIKLSKKLNEIQEELQQTDLSSTHSVSKDLMGAYLHFLRTGIWVFEGNNPQQALEDLLNEAPEHLTIELNKYLSIHVVWLRLVYQHSISLLQKLFKLVFDQDQELKLLMDQLDRVDSNQELYKRKLMEAFVVSKAKIIELPEYSFENLFSKEIKDVLSALKVSSDSVQIGTIDNLKDFLHETLINAKGHIAESYAEEDVIAAIVRSPYILINYLGSKNITQSRWDVFFKHFGRLSLQKTIEIVGHYTTRSQWVGLFIKQLGKDAFKKKLDRNTLIKSTLFLARADESALKNLLLVWWTKNEAKLENDKELIADKDFGAFMSSINQSLSSIFRDSQFLKKDIFHFENELKDFSISLKDEIGVALTIFDWHDYLTDILPFSKSLDSVKTNLAQALKADYPRHQQAIGLIFDRPIDAKEEAYSLIEFVVKQIETQTSNVAPLFKSFDDFEKHIVLSIKTSNKLIEALSSVSTIHLGQFLKRLSISAITLFEESIINKFAQSDFLDAQEQLLANNSPLKKQIVLASLVYGIKYSTYESQSYLGFIEEQVPELIIPETLQFIDLTSAASKVLPELYVEAFIHFIEYEKYIYLPLEQDGLDVAINKIITYWPYDLLKQLNKTSDSKSTALRIFKLIPDALQIYVFERLFPYYKGKVDYVIKELTKEKGFNQEELLADWVVFALTNQSALSIQQIIQQLEPTTSEFKSFKEVSKSIKPQTSLTEFSEAAQLPHIILYQGIEPSYQNRYTTIDLMAEVIRSGKFPKWSILKTTSEFVEILEGVAQASPGLLRIILQEELQEEINVRHLLLILGEKQFNQLLKISDVKKLKGVEQVARTVHSEITDDLIAFKGKLPSESLSEKFKTQLPHAILYQGIEPSYQNRYTTIDLIIEVIRSGKLPIWSKIQSKADFVAVITSTVKAIPLVVEKLLTNSMKQADKVQNLYTMLGFEKMIGLISEWNSSAAGAITKNVEKLTKIHASFGKRQALIDYFLISYTTSYFSNAGGTATTKLYSVLNIVAVDFGISNTDYIELLKQSKDAEIQTYVRIRTAGSYDESDEASTRQIDLLFHLVMHNEIPWWAKNEEIKSDSISKNIEELTQLLLTENIKQFLSLISERETTNQIYARIVPFIDNRQFDKAVLILSPDLGGFIISFSMLLTRRGVVPDKIKWFTYLLEYLNINTKFGPQVFLRDALKMAAELLGVKVDKLKVELLDIAKKAIQEGEMRFLPFVELLADKQIEERPSSIIKKGLKPAIQYDFTTSIVHYLKTGAMPFNAQSQMPSYATFIKSIKRQLQFGHNELRLAIIKTISISKVRTRIVKFEKDNFLQLLVYALYRTEYTKLMRLEAVITPLIQDKWPSFNASSLRELFYQSIFEHVLESHFTSISADDLIVSYLHRVSEFFHQEIQFSKEELTKLSVDPTLVSKLTTTQQSEDVSVKAVKKLQIEPPKFENQTQELLDQHTLVKNAGLVIVWPFLTRYFDMLEMTEKSKFKSEEAAVRGVHLLQYIATGTTLAPEHELLLNKVLCGLKISTPVPLEVQLSDKEKETTEMMLNGLLQNWGKLKSSSIDALREGFFIRNGYIKEKEKMWEMKVEKKTIDILMEQLPWAFGTIKLPYMEKRLIVEWN